MFYLVMVSLLLAVGGITILWMWLGFWPTLGVFLLAWSLNIDRHVAQMRAKKKEEAK
ncbi:MAG: hypothetical protein IMF11_20250 [Proteobacteria bacterium]|nr:hypothetical protein [Pseudomonadota bacterium]